MSGLVEMQMKQDNLLPLGALTIRGEQAADAFPEFLGPPPRLPTALPQDIPAHAPHGGTNCTFSHYIPIISTTNLFWE